METLDELLREVRGCCVCAESLPLGPRPVLRAAPTARLLLVGQAPGTRVHATGIPWNDASGERLREWMGIDKRRFYDPGRVAIMPMGFCYPGTNARGGDHPPRKECAPLWHQKLRAHLPDVDLTLLIGRYAQLHYLGESSRRTLTETVQAWRDYLPEFLPLPHPSWRNQVWLKRHPWFATEVLPTLRAETKRLT